MAYDSARARVVLFGGASLQPVTGPLNDTWEWDGQIWIQVGDIGPSPRVLHAMAYDAGRQRLVLFGGFAHDGEKNTTFGDTWEWNGEYWTQVSDTGPTARSDHAMTYDGSTGRVVLYGGTGGDNPGAAFETWEWDGEAWTQTENDIGPGDRTRHAMVYDEARKRVVLFGGQSGAADVLGKSDTWERSGGIWARVADTGPEPRHDHAMAYDGKRVILFGGFTGSDSNGATWQWDGKHWAQRGDFGPRPRFSLAMAYDSTRDRVVLFGGQAQGQTLGDTWELAEYPASAPS
jgi:hypothetical protein